MSEKKNLPIGGVITKGGTAHEYVTGGWRKLRPVLDKGKCTNCLICWVMCPDSAVIVEDMCPDSAVIVEDGKMIGFDMEHCKGCGICAEECPDKVKAIKMEEEAG
ncbi:MAG: 4Fe-4S binding protein [Deltaproteobacteria bacterium]|nr:4Fe-4S binding protein [Deltaproteobacteria bacterium]